MNDDEPGSARPLSTQASVWNFLRLQRRQARGGDTQPISTQPLSTQPLAPEFAALDGIRLALWHCYRHLFPSHSLAAQTPNGSIVISWSVTDDPNASHRFAAPVLLRLDRALVELLANSDATQRYRIAEAHEPALREGLRGYDPFARIPNARVVVLG